MNHLIKTKIKNVLFVSETGHKLYRFFGGLVQKKRSSLSDEEYVKVMFRENTGAELNIEHPLTFNDKLLWLSLYDHNPLKTKCADKYRVREYVAEAGYGDILNELYGVYDNTKQISLEDMPARFFVKTNHDSGTYALIDKDDPSTLKAFKRIDAALQRNYYYESREWQYKDIEPKVLCEAVIDTDDIIGLVDYRFFCFAGTIGFIAVDLGTTNSNGKHSYVATRNLYDENFELLDAKLKREHFNPELIKKPVHFEEMKKIAEKLSKPFKHVRVDLYNIHGKIIFGELTFCNGGGAQLLEPAEFNRKIGNMVEI